MSGGHVSGKLVCYSWRSHSAKGDRVTWKIKARRATQTSEILSDDARHAITVADELRMRGFEEVWIEDVNGNRIDEAELRRTAGL